MPHLESRTEFEVVDRGPDWLFVRLHPDFDELDHLADHLWATMDQHFIYRVVLEMQEVDFLPSRMMGQLVMLQKRILQQGGALRLCRLSPDCQRALHFCRLDRALPCFASREDAVLGRNLTRPR